MPSASSGRNFINFVMGFTCLLILPFAGFGADADSCVEKWMMNSAGNTLTASAIQAHDSLGEPLTGQSFGSLFSIQLGFFNEYFLPLATPSVTSTAVITPTQTAGLKINEGGLLAYPNPAKQQVHFALAVERTADVTIDVYRLTGERVARIVEQKDPGAQGYIITTWEAAGVAPGVYLCRILVKSLDGEILIDRKHKVALIR
ncbi:MAG: hypothetical protein AB1439_07970 [candidate division FCPU426 bacterium]